MELELNRQTSDWKKIAEQLAMGHWRTAPNAARAAILKRTG
jgi:hypothetical protein